jgi:hypothetical protein
MVAMGTSLADMAWGRDSAVYRISGVVYILGGWVLTAVLALLGSLLLTVVIWFGGMWVTTALLLLVFYYLYRSSVFYRERERKQNEIIRSNSSSADSSEEWLTEFREKKLKSFLIKSSKVYFLSLKSFLDDDLNNLQKTTDNSVTLNESLKTSKSELFNAIVNSPEENLYAGNLLVQTVDYFSEMVRGISAISLLLFNHLSNRHKDFTSLQKREVNTLLDEITSYFNLLIYIEKECRFDTMPDLIKKQELILFHIGNMRIEHLKKIKKGKGTTKTNVLFVELLAETKNSLLYSVNFIKTYQKLVVSEKNGLKSHS